MRFRGHDLHWEGPEEIPTTLEEELKNAARFFCFVVKKSLLSTSNSRAGNSEKTLERNRQETRMSQRLLTPLASPGMMIAFAPPVIIAQSHHDANGHRHAVLEAQPNDSRGRCPVGFMLSGMMMRHAAPAFFSKTWISNFRKKQSGVLADMECLPRNHQACQQ